MISLTLRGLFNHACEIQKLFCNTYTGSGIPIKMIVNTYSIDLFFFRNNFNEEFLENVAEYTGKYRKLFWKIFVNTDQTLAITIY